MFKDIDWKGALRRAALTVLIYLVLVYVLNVAFPGTSVGWGPTAINAAILFVILTFFHAFVERRKKRARATLQSQNKAKKDRRLADASEADGDGEIPASNLRGRQNPNTSRKKASRRRR